MTEEVIDRLARIETKLDMALKAIAGHGTRLTAAEQKIWGGAGGGAVILGLLGTVFYRMLVH